MMSRNAVFAFHLVIHLFTTNIKGLEIKSQPLRGVLGVYPDNCKLVTGSYLPFLSYFNATSIKKIPECKLVEDTYNIFMNEAVAVDADELGEFLKGYCEKSFIGDCFIKRAIAAQVCLTPEEIRGQNAYIDLFVEMASYLCQNDAKKITTFFNQKGDECGFLQIDEIWNMCRAKGSNSLTPGNAMEVSKFLLNIGDTCKTLIEIGQCIAQEFSKCTESKRPAKMISAFLTYVETETDCVNYPKIGQKMPEAMI